MYHVCDRPVIANYAAEYLGSYSIVTYTRLAQLSSVLASHTHLWMSQLIYLLGDRKCSQLKANAKFGI